MGTPVPASFVAETRKMWLTPTTNVRIETKVVGLTLSLYVVHVEPEFIEY